MVFISKLVVVELLFYVPPSYFVRVLCFSLFWYTLLCDLSSFAIILTRKRELFALLIVFGVCCYCKGTVALPHGVGLQCMIVGIF